MELRQLKIFVAVAEEGSFTRAAEKMGYAQSNMTTQIRLLEEEFHTKLFERLGKKIALTTEGDKITRSRQKTAALCCRDPSRDDCRA